MILEVLYLEGCPSHGRLLPTARRLARAAGAELRERRIETPEQAGAEGFLGSPSVRVDGVDVEPGARERADYGLRCRLYRTLDGLSTVPPADWIRGALARAATRGGGAAP